MRFLFLGTEDEERKGWWRGGREKKKKKEEWGKVWVEKVWMGNGWKCKRVILFFFPGHAPKVYMNNNNCWYKQSGKDEIALII